MNCDTSRVYSFSKGLPGTSSRLLTNLSCMFLSSSYASSGERSLSAQTQRIASMLLRVSLFGCRKPRVSSAKSTKSSFFVSQPMVLSLSFSRVYLACIHAHMDGSVTWCLQWWWHRNPCDWLLPRPSICAVRL